ncbi:MAG TPA: hypothetical protein VFE23_16180 [Usitatibacter sp.]|jgi:hypothetical protein|nr:hypothetical protein [Usitatibacter sp.]
MHGINPAIRAALGAGLAAASLGAAAADPQIVSTPAAPAYGQPVLMDLRGTQPYFLPAMRYLRQGNTITAEYEEFANAFGPFPPNLGSMPLNLGELPPGDYSVTARVFDIDHPATMLSTTTTMLSVAPPTELGVYSEPSAPAAYQDVRIGVRSAASFDAASLSASFGTDTIRVDFVYSPSLLGEPGLVKYASVAVGQLRPGTYHVEGWGRSSTGGPSQLYFKRDVTVAAAAEVVEYYNPALDHYFMAASGSEIALLDAGGQGGWRRTGQTFKAWLNAWEAPPQAKAVCRFYAKGPNSHFYTGDDGECTQLQQLEASQRAQLKAAGQDFLGWSYEGTAFYALTPANGECPASTKPVWRTYNGRAAQGDPNHRFTSDPQVRSSMDGWAMEGVAFCSPS